MAVYFFSYIYIGWIFNRGDKQQIGIITLVKYFKNNQRLVNWNIYENVGYSFALLKHKFEYFFHLRLKLQSIKKCAHKTTLYNTILYNSKTRLKNI